MFLSRSISLLSFFLAFSIGVLPSFILGVADAPVCREVIPPVFEPAPVTVDSMVGVWTGKWDKDQAYCTITIDRVRGDDFYGTLRKSGAVVKFKGTLDSASRTVLIKETKVISHGSNGRWSLGTNTGAFSLDGRRITGTGTDEYGTYFWDVAKD